ncbi:MAG: DNA methyltransferase [Planctomycetota bacterium]|nr:DNA methyltransferase [Planctomycetota bacterium]
MPTRKLSDIIIGNRIRKTFDIDGLVKSIEERGLLQPIGVRPDNTLVCGERRIRAVKKLGWSVIPVHVCKNLEDELAFLEAERDENTEREPLTPDESHRLAKLLEPKYAKLAKMAATEGRKAGGKTAGKGRPKNSSVAKNHKAKAKQKPKTRDQAAKSTGLSASTLRKVDEIKQAAKNRPKLYGDFADKLKSKGCKVNAVYKQFKAAEKAEKLRVAAEAIQQEAEAAEVAETAAVIKTLVDESDFRKWLPEQTNIAAIITDPPYPEEFLPLYSDLAKAAKPHVEAGAIMAVMCGQSYLPDVLARMTEHLKFIWCFAYLTPGGQAVQVWDRKVNTFWKPILLFGDPKKWTGDVVRSAVNDNDKDWHEWGQSVSGMASLIERITEPGDFIVDPMCGAGTTGVAAIKLSRRFAGCDISETSVTTANQRLTVAMSAGAAAGSDRRELRGRPLGLPAADGVDFISRAHRVDSLLNSKGGISK